MAQNQVEERVEATEREITRIKEAIMTLEMNMDKSIERPTLEVRENKRLSIPNRGESSSARANPSLAVEEGSTQKMNDREKGETLDQTLVRRDSMDRCKIKKLEMLTFGGDPRCLVI